MTSVTLNDPNQPFPEPPKPPRISSRWQEVDPAKNGWEVVTDAGGRELAVKELGALDQLDLAEACDAKADTNRYYFMALLATTVRAIDGQVLVFPRTNAVLRSHIAQVGTDGINAVSEWLAKRREAESAAKSSTVAIAKN